MRPEVQASGHHLLVTRSALRRLVAFAGALALLVGMLPVPVAEYVGYGLPLIELGVGCMLLVGFGTRWAALAAGAVHVNRLVGWVVDYLHEPPQVRLGWRLRVVIGLRWKVMPADCTRHSSDDCRHAQRRQRRVVSAIWLGPAVIRVANLSEVVYGNARDGCGGVAGSLCSLRKSDRDTEEKANATPLFDCTSGGPLRVTP